MATQTMTTTTTAAAPPNQSLYIQNLPEKFPKEELRRSLYILFSTYGPVLDVKALKTSKMRGQAHILLRDTQSATQALRALNGSELGGREMRISYSKKRSDVLAKLTGTFNQPVPAGEGGKGGQGQAQAGAAPSTSSFAAIPGSAPTMANSGSVVGTVKEVSTVPPVLSGTGGAQEAAEKAAAAQNAVAGTKRPRDEEEEEEEEAEMEVDEDDEEGAMEMSDDDD